MDQGPAGLFCGTLVNISNPLLWPLDPIIKLTWASGWVWPAASLGKPNTVTVPPRPGPEFVMLKISRTRSPCSGERGSEATKRRVTSAGVGGLSAVGAVGVGAATAST